MRLRTFLALIVFASTALLAQTFRGGILGTVTDSSGAAVADAQVTVASPDSGFSRTTTSDAAGNYTFTELPLGKYDITATKQGFRTQTVKGVSSRGHDRATRRLADDAWPGQRNG